MEELVYKPDIYEGKDPFIYASYHQDDRERVLRILEKLDLRGVRFWINDGITPGMETDEIIAEHIENCDFFIAFLSSKYLDFLDTVDELNYSRDVDKEYLLIYLEDVALPAGLDMRFMRAQNIKAFNMNDEEVYSTLISSDNAKRFYGIADPALHEEAERIFGKLEKLYPEHKVFALDAIGKQISKSLSELYVKAGYESAERLMLDYGFTHISTEEARVLRSSVLYQPGFEPEVIKPRIDYIIGELTAAYPGRIILDDISSKYKSIYKSLCGISVWLGYQSPADMLLGYGFEGVTSNTAGRIAIDHRFVLEELGKRYAGMRKPKSLQELIGDNPDLKANIKTISNRSTELFGMGFLQYLLKIGLIIPREKKVAVSALAKERENVIEYIRELYNAGGFDYGTYADAEETVNVSVIRKKANGKVYVFKGGSCNETVRIPYGVESIGKEAYADHSALKTLILPPTVKEIAESAFLNCDSLETIVFSEGLERIDNEAFSGCTSLKEISFPRSLKVIGNEAFYGCEELEKAVFGNMRTNVQEDAFDGCIYQLEELQDEGASPASLFELKVDKKNTAKIVAYNGDEEVVVIPQMIGGHPITGIEKGCFKGNEAVREIYISDHISVINGDVFKDCKNLEKVHMSNSVAKLTYTAFSGCTSLTEINIPDAMEEITRSLFKDCPLTYLSIGKNTKSISPDAFYKGEVTFMSGGAYQKKKVLERIDIDAGNEYFSVDETKLLSRDGKTLFMELGDPVRAVIPEGVEIIGPQAYEKLSGLSEVVFPSTLKVIGEKAFAETNLTWIDLPTGVEEIGPLAFNFCRHLSKIDLYDGLRVIGQQAFAGCPIEEIFIPASVESLGGDSFQALSNMPGATTQKFSVDMANKTYFADEVALYQRMEEGIVLLKAFKNGLRLRPNEEGPEPVEYAVAEGTTVIDVRAFANCNNLIAVSLPDSLRTISDLAFWNCSKLTEIHIPESCTEVSPKAFFGITVNYI